MFSHGVCLFIKVYNCCRMEVKIVSKFAHSFPVYVTDYNSGMDVFAFIKQKIVLKPLKRVLVPTGSYIELPEGFEAQIRPRSGLAVKHGLKILNTPGTMDADYRGEIQVILVNLSSKNCNIKDGDRICQMVISRHEKIRWKLVQELNDTVQGSGGFGHTGI